MQCIAQKIIEMRLTNLLGQLTTNNTTMLRAFPLLLIGWLALASCESEQVFVDRIVHDTIWVQGTPVKITETKTDTVWVTRTVNDTITVTQQVIVTDTVLLERVVQVVDTVYKEVVKTITVTEVDTVYVTQTEIVESRLTFIHPGANNYDGIYYWNESIARWLAKAEQYGMSPHARTIVFTTVRWGYPTYGNSTWVGEDGFYYVYMEFHDEAASWRAMSNVLLDIPYIEAPQGSYIDPDTGEEVWYSYGNLFWYEDYASQTVKPEYDHMMFQFFHADVYYAASEEKQDWYWRDMFGLL